MFEAFYYSSAHHPFTFWSFQVCFLVYLFAQKDRSLVWRAAVVLTGVAALDAWLTANHVVGFGKLRSEAASRWGFVFVVLGDLRFFLSFFLNDFRRAKVWMQILSWSLVVPLASGVASEVFGFGSHLRLLFITYEIMFLVVLGVFCFFHRGALETSKGLRHLSGFVALYYSLWVVSDAIILTTGNDLGFLIRMIPNILYYGLWIPVFFFSLKPRK